MAQPSSTSFSSDADILRMSVNTALAQIEKHAPQKDKALLRAMLEFAPSDKGKLSIAGHILQSVDSKNVSKLDQLADSYWLNIILPIRSAGGKTPVPSQNPSRGDPHGGETPFNVKGAKRNQSVLKKKALARDDFRCLATGRFDSQALADPTFVRPPFTEPDVTQAAHIIPFSLNDFTDTDKASVEQKTIIWTAIQAFCGKDISELKGMGINSIDNVMTLSTLAHKYFGELQLAFKAVPDVAGKYELVTFGKIAPYLGFPKEVMLKSMTQDPPPNPFYLAIHHAICNVLWASGRAEALEKAFREAEHTAVLAEDGGSAEVLMLALQRPIGVC